MPPTTTTPPSTSISFVRDLPVVVVLLPMSPKFPDLRFPLCFPDTRCRASCSRFPDAAVPCREPVPVPDVVKPIPFPFPKQFPELPVPDDPCTFPS